jgi:PAS domain S-box-containing protein
MRKPIDSDGHASIAHPAPRFVTDFTRLITDIDRLMLEIGSGTERSNGDARRPIMNGAALSLREQGHSFIKSLRHLELLLDRVPVPFMELDQNARILRTNQQCAHMLNGSATALVGKSLFRFVEGSHIKRLREHLVTARQTNRPFVVQLSLVHRGKRYPVEMRIRRQVIGSDTRFVAVVENASELHNATAMRNSNRKEDPRSMYDLLVNLSRAQTLESMGDAVGQYCGKAFGSPAGMIFLERDNNLQLVSQWRSRQIPKTNSAEEIIRKGPVARAFRTGEPVFFNQESTPHSHLSRCLYRLLRRWRSRSVTFLPISAPEQRPIGVLAIVLPETNGLAAPTPDDVMRLGHVVSGWIVRARAYEEAVAARLRAEHAVQTKEEFLSVLSHELRNPMMPILGWAVALSSGTLPADKQNLALEGIIRNVRALNYLIEDLFDAVRISSGKLRLQPAEIRIQDVAREALAAIQMTTENKKLRISTDISEAIPPFSGDPRRLLQVLMNLLNNAVKFTPAGGTVGMKIQRRGDRVECIVSDTGKGIERKFLPFVFDRFRQENRCWKGQAAGLGLGLAIVREIVELHGGSIQASSEGTDRGSTFVLRLPLHRKQDRIAAKPPADSQPALRKKISGHAE